MSKPQPYKVSPGKRWLPREGFTAEVVQNVVQKTLLSPAFTLPLYLLARYTNKGQGFALDHPKTIRRLKVFLCVGIARWLNGVLNRGALDNWRSDKPDWSKELVVITGGSDGIGKVLVHLFAARNIKVVILDVQAPTYELPNPNVHYLQVDLTDPSAIVSVSADLRTKYGHPTVVLLNAGIINRHAILSLPDASLERVFAVNTLAHYRLVREFLPHIVSRNHGLVATVASLAGFVTPCGMVDYCGTKAAAVAFHEGLTAELVYRYNAPKVRTVCVCPNFVATKLSEGFKNDSSFLSPTLQPESVAEAIFDKILRWQSGFVVVPRTSEWFTMSVRSWPYWMQKGLSNALSDVMRGVEQAEAKRVLAKRGAAPEEEEQEAQTEEAGRERAAESEKAYSEEGVRVEREDVTDAVGGQ